MRIFVCRRIKPGGLVILLPFLTPAALLTCALRRRYGSPLCVCSVFLKVWTTSCAKPLAFNVIELFFLLSRTSFSNRNPFLLPPIGALHFPARTLLKDRHFLCATSPPSCYVKWSSTSLGIDSTDRLPSMSKHAATFLPFLAFCIFFMALLLWD